MTRRPTIDDVRVYSGTGPGTDLKAWVQRIGLALTAAILGACARCRLNANAAAFS